jgi:hypothetical protein
MIEQEQLKNIVRRAIVEVIDARYDPYSIMFTYRELAIKIADIIISRSNDFENLPLLINEVRSNLVDSGFEVEELADVRYLSKKSKRLAAILKSAVNEIIGIIIEYFRNIEKPHYLFNDAEAQQIQVVQVQRWHEIRDDILKQATKKIVNEDFTVGTNDERRIINVLSEMYLNAPEGYQMTMVHLFGIMYAQELENMRIKDIVYNATGKSSLWVEVSKGIKLSKYIKMDKNIIGAKGCLVLNDNKKQSQPPSEYRIHLTRVDEDILRDNGVTIRDNRRLYTCDLFQMSNDAVESATPISFIFGDYSWVGSNWSSLVTDLVSYIIDDNRSNAHSNEDQLMKSCGHLFSENRKEDFFGPLENGWYIFLENGPVVTLREMLKAIAHQTNEKPLLCFETRSFDEPKKVKDIIVERELSAFQQYMRDQNFHPHQIETNIKCIRKLASLACEKEEMEWAFLIEPSYKFDNCYSIIKDIKVDFLNQSGCDKILEEFASFKKLIKYENFNLNNACDKNIKKRLDWSNLDHLEYSKPFSFSLYGASIEVSSWSELVHEVIHTLIEHNPKSMYRIAQKGYKIGHSKKPLISVDKNKLRMPKKTLNSAEDFYYENNLSARQKAKFLHELVINTLGVPASMFQVFINPRQD